jgi:CheY-like chemotaxis protein
MPTVLVVEDDAQIREIVKDELEDAGYSVVVAAHAAAADAILEARLDIHLVFTDIDMPGSMDGLKLAACVRDRWPPVHIIITTGKARPATIPANAFRNPMWGATSWPRCGPLRTCERTVGDRLNGDHREKI